LAEPVQPGARAEPDVPLIILERRPHIVCGQSVFRREDLDSVARLVFPATLAPPGRRHAPNSVSEACDPQTPFAIEEQGARRDADLRKVGAFESPPWRE